MTSFNHPYTPYPIQIDLMTAIYETIDGNYKVGIFESPTGTGKTLSIICATMTWLREYKRKPVQDSDDEPEWVKKAYRKAVLDRALSAAERYERHLQELENLSQPVHALEPRKKKPRPKDDDDFIPDDYYSDDETIQSKSDKMQQEIQELLLKVDGRQDSAELVNECDVSILFSSRTHSQLNQFASQLRLADFPSSFEGPERVKFLPLASRKQLCIHPRVSKYKDVTAINDACVDLQKGGKEGCEFLPKTESGLVKQFTDLNFTKIRDIEDLGRLGEDLHVCPYYSARSGVALSEIVALPYQLLLQKSTRESIKLSLKNAIVVIDEAHNLLDVISAMHSVSVKLSELQQVEELLRFYMKKFLGRLNGGNRINLTKLMKMVIILKAFMVNEVKKDKVAPGKEIPVFDIFHGTTGDLLNLHKLDKYVSASKIAYKIENYIEKLAQDGKRSATPLLFKIISFLKCLTNPSQEGKFFWDGDSDVSINYMLLDPSEMFRDVVEQAKCVLLCGGTMEPMSDYVDYLFPYLEPASIKQFSCGHVIPPENLNVYTVSKGPRGGSFEFSFDRRGSASMVEELGLALIQLARTVPDGMVVFFPSYKYLSEITSGVWKAKVWKALNGIKPVFMEASDKDVLGEYTNAITSGTGGILLSVVGGKLSEGINFSDKLARAVVMVGLPFPNAFSGELVARRRYIEDAVALRGGLKEAAKEAARNFYENICMRLVNQCVGRSIRHIGDYSTIYLFDSRYRNPRIENKLSGWVKGRLMKQADVFHAILKSTLEFFAAKE
ncbi:hypothetical protein BABINDRAFT_162020 [Babjeviella inositovora NRRL Y-12698]|uniref:ATP-dependent DNA helicase CHL1 n=1 Tax=Babjeviella inositovora NRRL Y-12698 TaxID=984486 RepID=A0A1E3QQ98_9ASCO|nr:uncharacterized protein BABINDRAFT_162020 [Babjeviella inositovora NRRL Y-12698]ODQ79644.1 hypothetical protein BABINDRAFT_162020 [Babjeviella inositovora NRRL Y-12698]